jgi:phosphoglucomutase
MDTENQPNTQEIEQIEASKNLKLLIACADPESETINKIQQLGIEVERFSIEEGLQSPQDAFSLRHLKPALEHAMSAGSDLVLALDSRTNKFALALKPTPKDPFVLLSFHQLSTLIAGLLIEEKMEVSCQKSIFVTETITKIFERAELSVKTHTELYSPLRETILAGDGQKVLYLSENQEMLLSGLDNSLEYLIENLLKKAIELNDSKQNLFDKLMELFQYYGFRKEKLMTGDMSSSSQKKFFAKIIDTLKKKTPEIISGCSILSVTDLAKGTSKSKISGRVTPSEYPEMNAVKVFLSNGVSFIMTPIGEKIVYFMSIEGTLTKKEDYIKNSSAFDARMVKFISELNRV